jgi:phenylalanyl-tRNA synthetase beta chain
MIRDVEIKPSPLWMRLRLERAGLRPISNIVDITNYVMWELGQPLHAFDYADVHPRSVGAGGQTPAIIVRRAAEGERMATLDGEMRVFDDQMLLITDGQGPVGIAGVMGGLDSEVGEGTRDVLLEAASFHFLNIRRTGQKLKLQTEASSRFGKRVDPELTLPAAARAAELMQELAGASIDPFVGDLYPGRPEARVILYDPVLADRLLGTEIPRAEQVRILEALEFGVVASEAAPWQVTVPSYRLDVGLPVDLVEEVARIWGYDKSPTTLIDEELPPLRRNVPLEGEERTRDILVGLGLDEVISYSLIDPEDEARLHPEPDKALAAAGRAGAAAEQPLAGTVADAANAAARRVAHSMVEPPLSGSHRGLRGRADLLSRWGARRGSRGDRGIGAPPPEHPAHRAPRDPLVARGRCGVRDDGLL